MSMASQTTQHPPQRMIPAVPWARLATLTVALFAIAIGSWEFYWGNTREFVRGYRDDIGMWAYTRRQLDADMQGSTAIVGGSRILFGADLAQWQQDTGQMPYQLSLMGTSPRPFLEELAVDSEFSGLLVVGVTPVLFFTPLVPLTLYYGHALDHYRDQTPSQRIGYRISRLIEPWIAFYHWDSALFAMLRRQAWWPERDGYQLIIRLPRRLEETRSTRQVDMWHVLENDPEHQAFIHDTWRDFFNMPLEIPPPDVAAQMQADIRNSVSAQVRLIRERGGEVVFVRMPSNGEFLDVERQGFPREVFWDPLIEATGTVGIHFEDYPELQDVRLPEWSHIHSDDKTRFTQDLIVIIREALEAAGTPRSELDP